ncbi:MAG: transketolase [Bacteroidetes bacterium HGW-Bacteroidetes-6]|jgi:transketolase|nr:MAG: transketolase [Bacteroidetes bacterium HGW-Bacteroidetes-6]
MSLWKNNGNRPTRFGFGEGVRDAARDNSGVVGIGADITASVSMNMFADEFPDRFYSLGIAEQNCISVAAGFALTGLIPVFSTYGVFASMRAADQIRVSVCYNNLHVIIGGAHAGISVGPDGATHQALEDIAVMRVLPNMTVLSPCDATQTRQAAMAAINRLKGPVYIRFGREAVPDFTLPETSFEIGKGQLMREGSDLTIVATGHLVWHALQAAEELNENNISVRVINIHTIKPIDKEILIESARSTGAIVTAEEHQIAGGLGSAVAEVLVENCPVPMAFVGMRDSFGESGKPEELMEKYGLSTTGIVLQALALYKRKQK